MKVQVHDLLHGAALTQLVEHPRFKALNKASSSYGHYLVNSDRRLWVKYLSSSGGTWRFQFSPDEMLRILVDGGDNPEARVFTALVCGDHTVCVLSVDELWSVLDPDLLETEQHVRVSAPAGKSMRVSGPHGSLTRTVPHNRFPDLVMQ